jgi:hypothetical protein
MSLYHVNKNERWWFWIYEAQGFYAAADVVPHLLACTDPDMTLPDEGLEMREMAAWAAAELEEEFDDPHGDATIIVHDHKTDEFWAVALGRTWGVGRVECLERKGTP